MDTTGTTTTWDLAHLVVVLRRRVRWIVAAAIVAVVVSLALALVATPIYRSQVDVLIEPEVTSFGNPEQLGRVFFLEQELVTQARLAESEVIAERVIDSLSLGQGPGAVLVQVQVVLVPSTRVLRISASDADPQRARQLAQAFADEYLEYRREIALGRLTALTNTLQTRIDLARDRVDDLDAAIARESDAARLAVLRDDRRQSGEELALLRLHLERLDATVLIAQGGGEILKAATLPSRPAEPRPARSAAVALVLGLGLGTVVGLAREALDRRVRTVADAVETAGRPALGRIPLVSEDEGGDLPMLRHPSSPPSEAFRDLRTNLRFVGRDGPPSRVLVTSALQGEGKSFVAVNLALAAAAAGQHVVLLDADLRRPAIGGMLGLGRGVGLSDVLVGRASLDDALVVLDPPHRLAVLRSGPTTPIPNELLGSEPMVELLDKLGGLFDLVVIDAPPVLVVPDALEMAADADATLIVVELGQSGRPELADTCDRLQRVGGHVSGIVVNRADLDPMRYGYYYYHTQDD